MTKLQISVVATVVVEGPHCHSTCRFRLRHTDERQSCILFQQPIEVKEGAMQRVPDCQAAGVQ